MIYKAKKSLGQNFLKSEVALKKIIETGEIKPDETILEIGPGKGALTRKLLEKAGLVVAVEKDRELFEFLKTKFEKEITEKKLLLIKDDILEFEITKLARQDLASYLKPLCYKIIANIPYNITGAILKKFLTAEKQPERMVLLVQKEVAQRMVGRGSNPSTPLRVKESILSISVKAYGEPKMIMKVPARYFSPAPKVDSAVILIKNISRKNFTSPPAPLLSGEGGRRSGEVIEQNFWEIVKAGFAHKRKKLSSNLKTAYKNNKYENLPALVELGNKRAEELTLEEWKKLAGQ